jgi:hypothetical protein
MIDSQTQVRWLAVAVALIVFVIGPVVAGKAVPRTETTTTDFTVFDLRSTEIATHTDHPNNAAPHVIFLASPGMNGECAPEATASCPALDAAVVVVPMSADVEDTAARLEQVYPGLTATTEAATLTRVTETFGWKSALVVGALLLIGALLAVGGLATRHPRRLGLTTGYPAATRSPTLPRDDSPMSPPRQYTPPRPQVASTPVLTLADLPGAREVIREHGATAKARSHIDGAGGYVALGDVLMWATPVAGGVAFPDDDVHVTVPGAVTPTLDGGSRP